MNDFQWSSNLAYAVGLIASDGNLSKDGRHLDLTSKDIEQLENFKKCLGLKNNIGWKSSGLSGKKYPRIQFGNVKFYRWLEKIGLHPSKSKTIGSLKITDKYFFDFLRGSFDGDGCFYSYWDKRWKSSFMFYLQFTSASLKHIDWLKEKIEKLSKCEGRIKANNSVYQLVFAKCSSRKIIDLMYFREDCIHLSRKKIKIEKALEEEKNK